MRPKHATCDIGARNQLVFVASIVRNDFRSFQRLFGQAICRRRKGCRPSGSPDGFDRPPGCHNWRENGTAMGTSPNPQSIGFTVSGANGQGPASWNVVAGNATEVWCPLETAKGSKERCREKDRGIIRVCKAPPPAKRMNPPEKVGARSPFPGFRVDGHESPFRVLS